MFKAMGIFIAMFAVSSWAGPVPTNASARPYNVGIVNVKTGSAFVPLYFGLLLQTNNVGARTTTPAGNGVTSGYDIFVDPVNAVVSYSNPYYSVPFHAIPNTNCYAPNVLGFQFSKLCHISSGYWSLYFVGGQNNDFLMFTPAGLLYEITRNGKTKRLFRYDSSGRMLSWQDEFGNTLQITYSSANRVASMSYGGRVFTFGYDGNNNLTSIAGSSALFTASYSGKALPQSIVLNDTAQKYSFTYDSPGDVQSYSDGINSYSFLYGSNSSNSYLNGATAEFIFDSANRPSEIKTASYDRFLYYADALSEVESSDLYNGVLTQFQYNAFGQRTQSSSGGIIFATMTYDSAGRSLSTNISGVNPVQNTFDVTGRLASTTSGTQAITYTYDGYGCLASSNDGVDIESYTNNSLCQNLSVSSSGADTFQETQTFFTSASGHPGFDGSLASTTYSSGQVISDSITVTGTQTTISSTSVYSDGSSFPAGCTSYDANWVNPNPSLGDNDFANFPGAMGISLKTFFVEGGTGC